MSITPLHRYLLDTNVLLLLTRGSRDLVAEMESRFSLFTGRNRLFVSYVTVAEIRVIGEHNRWGKDKWTALNRLLVPMEVWRL